MDISGYALITGAASGIGRACALSFAKEGAKGVALLDITAAALDAVKAEVESLTRPQTTQLLKVISFVLDVTNEDEVIKTVNAVAKAFGRIDYVVNCAGIAYKHLDGAAYAETKEWERVIAVNLHGTFYTLKAAAQIMLKQDFLSLVIDGRSLQRGSIVNIASILGIVAIPQSTGYIASKHAVVGLTKTASEDHASHGLRINAICPGYIETPLAASTPEIARTALNRVEQWTTMKRFGKPQEVADAVLFLSGGRSSFITGSALVVDGGYTSH